MPAGEVAGYRVHRERTRVEGTAIARYLPASAGEKRRETRNEYLCAVFVQIFSSSCSMKILRIGGFELTLSIYLVENLFLPL